MDKITFKDSKNVTNLKKEEFEYNYQINMDNCFCFNWPYFCGVSINMDSLIISNVFDPNKIFHFIMIPTNATVLNIVGMIIVNS